VYKLLNRYLCDFNQVYIKSEIRIKVIFNGYSRINKFFHYLVNYPTHQPLPCRFHSTQYESTLHIKLAKDETLSRGRPISTPISKVKICLASLMTHPFVLHLKSFPTPPTPANDASSHNCCQSCFYRPVPSESNHF
jgi:hypothetical protein